MIVRKTMILLAIAAASLAAQAQAPSSPAKKELVARILKLQQPGIEAMARRLVEDSAHQLMARAAPALAARIPQDQQEKVGKEIDADARKYVSETAPIVRDRALKLAPTTVGALLEEKFTEEELKQVVTMMEAPVYTKFQGLGMEMQNVLAEKLVADTREQVQVKLRAFEETLAKRLGAGPAQAGGAPAPKAAGSGKK